MLARISVKKPYTVIVAIILVIALGAISFMNMTTDLLPSMDLPYVIVYTVNTGSTPEANENDITRPLESAFSTLTNIKNVTSTSSENLSLVVLEFTSGADMNTAMIEISSQIDQVSGGWDDSVGTPIVMKLNPDMLPVAIAAVNKDGTDLLELSDFVEDELVPQYEAVDGVASVNASGLMTQQVDITIEQSRIDTLNSAILREVDSKLADTEQTLRDAQSQINSGKSKLSSMRSSVLAQIDEAVAAIDSGEAQLPIAIATLNAQREQLVPQLEAAQAAVAQLQSVQRLSEEDKAAAMQIGTTLENLKAQRDALQEQLDSGSGSTDALQVRLEALTSQRATVAALCAEEESYVESLQLLDRSALEQTISDLSSSISTHNTRLAEIRSGLEDAITERDQASRDLAELDAQIALLEPSPTGKPEATPTATAEGSTAPTSDATNEPVSTETEQTALPTDASETAPSDTSEAPVEPTAAASESTDTEPVSDPEEPVTPVQETKPEAPAQEQQSAPAVQEPAVQVHEIAWNFSLIPSARAEGKTLEELRAERVQVAARLELAQANVDSLTEQHDALRDTITEEQTALDAAKASLEDLESGNIAIQEQIDAAKIRIESYNSQITELDSKIEEIRTAMSTGDTTDALATLIADLNAQIASIEGSEAYQLYLLVSDTSALDAQIEQATSAVTQLEAGIASIDDMLAKLDQEIIPGGMIQGIDEDTKLSEAREALVSARAQAISGFATASAALSEAEDELASAWKEFIDARDEALENAGISGIVTVSTISSILGAQNLDLPAGYVSDESGKYLVSVGTKFSSLSELKQSKLFSLGLETVDDVRLLDVASVTISDNSEDLFTLLNGQSGILLSFEKQSTASTADVAGKITEKSSQLMEKYPGLSVIEMMNQGDYIDLIVDSVLQNLLYGGILAVLILLLFLMDWRPTMIIAISIPTSVVVAFVGMYFCNITLNVMSLSGLALGVGMLVDNSIVSIENIYRLRNEEHMPILTSCIMGVKQVGGALIASTLTTVCIFLPIVFIQGTARELFGDMGLTFAFSLLASLLVSMTVVPSFSATLFRHSKPREHKVFAHIQNGYTALLRGALRVKPLVIVLALGLFAYTCMQVPKMAMSLMPGVNSTQMQATLTFSGDSTMTEKEEQALATEIMDQLMNVDGVTDVSLTASSSVSMISSLRSSSGGYSYYILVEEGKRDNSAIADDMEAACAGSISGKPVTLDIQESTMDMSSMMGQGISVNITGTDFDTMRTAAEEVAEICRGIDGAENVDDGSSEAEPKLIITVDKELAKNSGLTVAQVYQHIAQRLNGGVKLTEATLDGREYSLYVYTDKDLDLTPDDLSDMEIEVTGTDKVSHVLVGDVATITSGQSPESIRRSNQKRTISVSFDIADGYSANLVSRDLKAALENYTPPAGCSYSYSGENETLMEYMSDLVKLLAIAILFIFLIMVAQFQSFKSPIIVMFTIPLAFTGGLLALLLTHLDLSVIAMVGFLMLSGVVVNNGIVFIDSVNQMRIAGSSKRDALIETGRIRLRPILMSALTTILGMLTMALGTGMGAEMMQPMAIVTIGGLAYSTLMTLFVIPALYDIVNGETMKAREIEMIKEASGLKREGFDDEDKVF